MYNKNFVLKNVGYFHNYTYKYKDYLINKNILEPLLLKDKCFIIFITHKNFEENITGICYFNNYTEFLNLLNNKIKINEKNISNTYIIIQI
jgi:hypothetical protein